MKLETVYLEVDEASLDEIKAFYGDQLGLEATSEEPGESIWYDAGIRLGFHVSPDASGGDPGLVNLSFAVADADVEAERLTAAGIAILQGPMDAPWNGGRVAVVLDPVGHTVWLSGPPGQRPE
jgi:predicted enzyme related to lactoylglutathione lyase